MVGSSSSVFLRSVHREHQSPGTIPLDVTTIPAVCIIKPTKPRRKKNQIHWSVGGTKIALFAFFFHHHPCSIHMWGERATVCVYGYVLCVFAYLMFVFYIKLLALVRAPVCVTHVSDDDTRTIQFVVVHCASFEYINDNNFSSSFDFLLYLFLGKLVLFAIRMFDWERRVLLRCVTNFTRIIAGCLRSSNSTHSPSSYCDTLTDFNRTSSR